MSLQDDLAKAQRTAEVLQAVLAVYPEATRGASGQLVANVPLAKASAVRVNTERAEVRVCFGDGSLPETVWNEKWIDAGDLLEGLLDAPGGKEAIAAVLESWGAA